MDKQQQFQKQLDVVKEFFKQVSAEPLEKLKRYLVEAVNNLNKEDPNAHTTQSLLNSIKEGNGKLAIHFAASRGDVGVFRFLVEQGADPQLKDDLSNSVLHIAVEHQRQELVQYLLDDLHIDANLLRLTVSPLHQAAQCGNIPIADMLLHHGALIDAESQYGSPLLFAAARNQNWYPYINESRRMCLHLLKRGANPNIKSEQMPPILHLAIDQNNKELFETLVTEFQDKIDVNITDWSGWSALQLCAESGRTEMLQKLIALNANVDYENLGQTALDLAVQHNKWDCAELVRSLARRKEAQLPPAQAELTDEQKEDLLKECIALKEKGNLLFAEKDYPKALEVYQEALNLCTPIRAVYPDKLVPICTNVASCLMQLKRYQEIIEVCLVARKITTKWIKIYYFEGHAYEALGEYGEAAASYFDAMKIDANQIFKKMFDEAVAKGKAAHKAKQLSQLNK